MRSLNLKPASHEITLSASFGYDPDIGAWADVHMKLSSESSGTSGSPTASEAARIGKWFMDLSKEISKKDKEYRASLKEP